VLQQVTVWLPAEVLQLIRMDRFNLSAFVRQQIELVYGDGSAADILNQRLQLIEAAKESIAQQRQIDAARDTDIEQARTAARAMRAEREAAKIRQDGIADALLQVIGDNPSDRYRRMLPENDREGDLVDDWDALVRRISRLCGAEIDSAEVAAGLRHLLAKA
jgi:regulator of protease activity HflC (stomatin/prohibitin superfamily)